MSEALNYDNVFFKVMRLFSNNPLIKEFICHANHFLYLLTGTQLAKKLKKIHMYTYICTLMHYITKLKIKETTAFHTA